MDEVTIRVSFGPFPTDPANEVYEIQVYAPPADEQEEQGEYPYLRLLEPITRDESPYRGSYSLDIQKRFTAWGAAGATTTILLFVASAVGAEIVGTAAWETLRTAFTRFTNWSNTVSQPLERQEAVERARWKVQQEYHVESTESLALVEDEHDVSAQRWRIVLRDDERIEYVVELGLFAGLPNTIRIARRIS